MADGTGLRFYYRDGCHLCEEMAAALHARWPDLFAEMEWIDVDSDPALQTRFGVLIPVLANGEEILCQHLIDPVAVVGYLNGRE